MIFIVVFVFFITLVSGHAQRRQELAHAIGYLITTEFPSGEVRRRLRCSHFVIDEVTHDLTTGQLKLQQVTNNQSSVRIIYGSDGSVSKCELLSNVKHERLRDSVTGYLKSRCELCIVRSVPIRNWDEVPPDLMPLLDTRELYQRCHHQTTERKTYLPRVKRALYLLPGTNWCGKGNNGRDYQQLGTHAAADRCCRDHDHCPYMIEGLTTKFGLFNFRFYTISYCKCDERFRSCLKLMGTTAGNFVGRLYFNIIQTKCFMFRIERVCVERSWWGRCLKYEEQRRGYIREGLRY